MKKPVNENYCATVVALDQFVEHDDCQNVKTAMIAGCQVIVSKNATAGDVGLFFPLEVALSSAFLSSNNLYRDPTKNVDITEKGFFEEHGRVRCVKFRGHKSEGFYIPLSSLAAFTPGSEVSIPLRTEFDEYNGFAICKKYVPKSNRVAGVADRHKAGRVSKEELIAPGQFRFHPDTAQLRKNIHRIEPDTIISITRKIHGTSVVIGNLLVVQKPNLLARLAAWLGVPTIDASYGLCVSSRRVIKSVGGEEGTGTPGTRGFYGEPHGDDVWTQHGEAIAHQLPDGYTLYGEIVGYNANGSAIQKGYDYGCLPGKSRLVAYRLTSCNVDGEVLELSWPQLKEFCTQRGIEHVEEYFYGTAEQWARENVSLTAPKPLLEALSEKYLEKDCKECPGLPDEGVVIRIDHLESCESFKLKSYRFLEHETKDLDKGIVDTETSESEAA